MKKKNITFIVILLNVIFCLLTQKFKLFKVTLIIRYRCVIQLLSIYGNFVKLRCCASKYPDLISSINPAVIIFEEAAEIAESHLITSLVNYILKVVLIGDHLQLRPKPNVYPLAKDFNLEILLFERLINNRFSH